MEMYLKRMKDEWVALVEQTDLIFGNLLRR